MTDLTATTPPFSRNGSSLELLSDEIRGLRIKLRTPGGEEALATYGQKPASFLVKKLKVALKSGNLTKLCFRGVSGGAILYRITTNNTELFVIEFNRSPLSALPGFNLPLQRHEVEVLARLLDEQPLG